MKLQPNYIVDNHNQKIAVQLDIETYNKITEALEDYALVQLIEQEEENEKLSLEDAKTYYQSLKDTYED